MLFVCHPQTLQKPWLRFLLGVKMVRRETENNAYVKFDFWNNVLKSRPCKSALEPFFEQTTTVSVLK